MEILLIIVMIGFGLGVIATFTAIKLLLKNKAHGEFKFCKECEIRHDYNKQKFEEKFDVPEVPNPIFTELDEIEV
jgi:hypothetical protein